MNLSIADRIALLSILPSEGNITTIKIVRELKESLSFSEEEHKVLDLANLPDGVRWNREAEDPMKDIQIGEKATDIIVESLKAMNDRSKLLEAHLGIWEIFMDGK